MGSEYYGRVYVVGISPPARLRLAVAATSMAMVAATTAVSYSARVQVDDPRAEEARRLRETKRVALGPKQARWR